MSIYTGLTHIEKKKLLREKLNEVSKKWRNEQELIEGRNDFVNWKEGEE